MNTQNTKPAQVGHTPGPWSVFGCTVYQDDCWNAGHNEGGQRICSTYSGSDEEQRDEIPTDEQGANAEFIATACNNHEYFVKAFRSIIAVLDGRQPKDIPGAIMVAQSALDRAEGRL